MYKESPALGESAGLEVKEVERRVDNTTSTSFILHKFQPHTNYSCKRIRYCFNGRRRAFHLLRQVQRLITWRLFQGVVLSDQDRHQVTFVLATLLASSPPSRRKTKAEPIWHSLDHVSLSLAVEDVHGMQPLGEAETMTIIHDVLRYREAHPQRRPISSKAIGKLLQVHAVEREASRCWNILPVDQSESQRKRQQAERERDRERKRAQRQGKHVSLDEIHAKAEKRKAFCEAQGIDRRTLTRWINAGRCRIEQDGTVTLRQPVAQ